MFEMKYDREGNPIPQQAPEPTPEPAPVQEVLQEAIQEIEQEAPTQEDHDHHEEQQAQEQANTREENLRRLREKSERLQKERDEAFQLIERMKNNQPAKEEEFSLSPDDLVEGKHLTKYERKIKHLEEMAIEAKLKAQYPDFDSIVSAENVSKLREIDPDVAEAIYYTPDLYKKGALAYKMIKKLGVLPDAYASSKATAQKNVIKPRSPNSIAPQQGESALSKANAFANGLTPELRAQLQREMEEARRNY
jgi:hypothetical protein